MVGAVRNILIHGGQKMPVLADVNVVSANAFMDFLGLDVLPRDVSRERFVGRRSIPVIGAVRNVLTHACWCG